MSEELASSRKSLVYCYLGQEKRLLEWQRFAIEFQLMLPGWGCGRVG